MIVYIKKCVSTIEVNWFDPNLLFDIPRKLFTILELSRRCVLFTIFLAQLLTTLKILTSNFRYCVLKFLIFRHFWGKVNKQTNKKKTEKIYHSDQEDPWNSNLVLRLNECGPKAAGTDNLSGKFLKDGTDILAIPILQLFNSSIKLSLFPRSFKIGKVEALFKKGSKTDPQNYHSISLFPFLSKIIGRVIWT